MTEEIAWSVVEVFEGGRQLHGYVPTDDGGPNEAGVTIGSGVDLAFRNTEWLWRKLNDAVLIGKLAPYMGLPGDMARAALAVLPLELTELEADLLDGVVRIEFTKRVKRNYNPLAVKQWAFLTVPQRTVIMSVAWQYGADLAGATPNFWGQVCRSDWRAAIVNLRDFGDAFGLRRDQEADYLEESL